MSWGAAQTAGFVLGALLSGDRELREVRAHLDEAALTAALARLSAVPQGPETDKTSVMRALAHETRPPLTNAEVLPPRARALLATMVPKELGRAWLRDAPLARAGFEPEASFVMLLARLARSTAGENP